MFPASFSKVFNFYFSEQPEEQFRKALRNPIDPKNQWKPLSEILMLFNFYIFHKYFFLP